MIIMNNFSQSPCKAMRSCIIKIAGSYLLININSYEHYLVFVDPGDLLTLLKDIKNKRISIISLSEDVLEKCRIFSENILQKVRDKYGDICRVDCVFIEGSTMIFVECKYLDEKYVRSVENFIIFLYHRVVSKFLIFDFLLSSKYGCEDSKKTIWIFICIIKSHVVMKKLIECLRSMSVFCKKVLYLPNNIRIILLEIPYISKIFYVIFLDLGDDLVYSVNIPIELIAREQ